MFIHHDSVVNLIIKIFIRSAWVIEGMGAQAQQDPAQQRNEDNLQSLIKLLCITIRASHGTSYFLRGRYTNEKNPSSGSSVRVTAQAQDLVKIVHMLIKRLALDNRGPNHPEAYFSTILQSELFSEEIFGKIIDAPLIQKGSGHSLLKSSTTANFKPVDQLFLSKMKNELIKFLGLICNNDPALISRIVDNKTLKRVLDANSDVLPITHLTQQVYVDFVRMVSVHELGREAIKSSGLFEKVMMPKPVPIEDVDAGDDALPYLQMVMLSAASDRHRDGAITSYQDLVRNRNNNCDYFLDTTSAAVHSILEQTKQAALRLQKKYYQRMSEAVGASDPEGPKTNQTSFRQFMVTIVEELTQENDYYFIKFQVDKLHQIFQPSHYDGSSLMGIFLQIMSEECRKMFFDLYEILTTIKPAYEFAHHAWQPAGQLGLFACLDQIINVTVYSGHNGALDGMIKHFQERFKLALQNLSEIVTKVNGDAGLQDQIQSDAEVIRTIDLYATFRKCEVGDAPAVEHTGTIAGIDSKNLRGALAARALIVCQYCRAYELTRRETQQALSALCQWHAEMTGLQAFVSSITKCTFNITSEFFSN